MHAGTHQAHLLLDSFYRKHAGKYVLTAQALGSAVGRLKVDIEDAAGRPAGQSELSLTVSAELQQASLTLAFSEGELEEALNETLSYPETLSSSSATLDPSQTLKVRSPTS